MAETPADLRALADRLIELLRQIENHCPCGARPESPETHPHVGGCPVSDALEAAAALQALAAQQERSRIEFDNRHNAILCPDCNPHKAAAPAETPQERDR